MNSNINLRRIFIVVAGGNVIAERHFIDTIKNKRRLNEIKEFLPDEEREKLINIYHESPFIVWGAVPTEGNIHTWESMNSGDIVLIYNKGFIKFIGEVAIKVRNKNLSKYFWKETSEGQTWELIYFIMNEKILSVPMEKINELFGYRKEFRPRGFTVISTAITRKFVQNYGDIMSILDLLDKNQKPILIPHTDIVPAEVLDEKIEKSETEHDEMQWRLIRLGKLGKFNVWIPKHDQSKQYQGNIFKQFVLPEFHESLDVPPTIKNIDVVWKFGPYSIKSAFEIEHSTAIYSGILRLSDLRSESPNSNYPLFIVAPDERKRRVFDELRRPTFSGPCLRLNEIIKFLGYKVVRDIDESYKNLNDFNINILFDKGEIINVKD